MVTPRVQAQQSGGESLNGSVSDPVGSAVPGAVVVARNESSGVETKTTTNQEGKFSIPNLAAGTYTVEVSAPGFALAIRRGLDARAQDLNMPLSLGSVSDAITVEANTSGSIAALLTVVVPAAKTAASKAFFVAPTDGMRNSMAPPRNPLYPLLRCVLSAMR